MANNIRHICYIVAMKAEAAPFIREYGLELSEGVFAPLPAELYQGHAGNLQLSVVLNGRIHGMDLIGCEAASITTQAVIEKLHPDLIINSGTCGGFMSKGASIAKVYIGNEAMFHDRRVPGDDDWGTQSLGNYKVWEGSASLADKLGFETGKVTTGSSLDMQPCDLDIITQGGGELKDMEGAAIGFVCSLYDTPVMYVKSVTDMCDGNRTTIDEFRQNLQAASESLRDANRRIVSYFSENCS